MIVQVAAYSVAILLVGYLAMRCFGRVNWLSDRAATRRRQAIEQARLHYERVSEYERRKAAGLPVGPPPRMPLAVAVMLTNPSAPWL